MAKRERNETNEAAAMVVSVAAALPMPVPGSLAAALLVAQSSVDAVGRDARNEFHKYRYTSAEGMIGACRAAFGLAGIAVRRASWALSPDGQFVQSSFEMAFPPTGERVVDVVAWPVVAEKGRPFDKALAGALTTSLSYWLRDTLLLPRQDEPEENMDRRDDRPQRPQPRPAAPAVRGLNDRLQERGAAPTPAPAPVAPPAAKAAEPAEPVHLLGRGFVHGHSTRAHGERSFVVASIEPEGSGRPLEFICASADVADTVRLATNTRVRYAWRDRGPDRAGMLVDVQPDDSADAAGGDDAVPF